MPDFPNNLFNNPLDGGAPLQGSDADMNAPQTDTGAAAQSDPVGSQGSPTGPTGMPKGTEMVVATFPNKVHILGYDTLVQFAIPEITAYDQGWDMYNEWIDHVNVSTAYLSGDVQDPTFRASRLFKIYDKFPNSSALTSQYVSTLDAVRALLGAYWSYSVLDRGKGYERGAIEYKEGKGLLATPKEKWFGQGPQFETLFTHYEQNIYPGFDINNSPLTLEETKNLILPTLDLSCIDIVTTLDLPKFDGYARTIYEKYGVNSSYLNLVSDYNFYLTPYEETIGENQGDNYPEYTLPNIYTFLHEIANENENINLTNLRSLISYDQQQIWPSDEPIGLSNISFYLNRYATFFKKNREKAFLSQLKNTKRTATTGISINHLDFLKQSSDYKSSFPMHVEIDIPVSNTGPVLGMFKKANFFDKFMKTIMMSLSSKIVDPSGQVKTLTGAPARQFLFFNEQAQVTQENIQKQTIDLDGDAIAKRKQNVVFFDLNEVFDSQNTDLSVEAMVKKLNPEIPEDKTVASAANSIVLYGEENFTTSAGNIIDFIRETKFKLQFAEFVDKHLRDVKDIYSGKLAYSEILFYEIVKYKIPRNNYGNFNNNTAQFVQNMFIPNDGSLNVLKYVDTQVKYGEHYYYQVYAHTFVVGTSYTNYNNYEGEGSIETGQARYRFSPALQLLRFPYFNTLTTSAKNTVQVDDDTLEVTYRYTDLKKTVIKDKPPVFPDINILPFKGENRQILINFNFMGGEYNLDPIVLSPNEEEEMKYIREAQDKTGGPIIYKTDEFSGFFEAYRIDKKPTSYEDFKPIEQTRRPRTPLNSEKQTGFIDTLLPNRDYYYMFRVRDIHGNMSNPTPVFQVRIVDTPDSAPYLVLNMLYIGAAPPEVRSETAQLMKYIKIKPSFAQSFIDQNSLLSNFSSAEEIDGSNLSFGFKGKKEDVFGKKFKVRLTSNKTGKKMDININVKRPDIIEKTDKTS